MAKFSILIAFLTYFLCALGQSQLSQCSEYFTYMSKPGTTDMLGQIEIPPPSANDIFYLKVALSNTTELSQVVRLELAQSIKESVGRVHHGRPLLYHIYCPINEQIPSVSAIWFNGQRYCPSSEVSGNITVNVELGHILSPPNTEPIVYQWYHQYTSYMASYGPWQEISQPWHRNLSIYRIDNPPYDRLNLNDTTTMTVSSSDENANECGITSYYTDDTNRLASDGEKTLPGQWPWLVAIYTYKVYTGNGVYRFSCTGSILTTRHVITDGRCVTIWRDKGNELINFQKVFVRFGELKSREEFVNYNGINYRFPVDIKTFSEDLSKRNNLAILIFRTAIQYNAFVKPICLWSGSNNLQDTVNITGYIVGWGQDYIGNESRFGHWETYYGELRMAKVPLMNLSVDTIEEQFFFYHPVDFPCYNDIGGGLMVFNTTMSRYQLRGITGTCQPEFIKFFDVTKVTSWIQQQILLT